MTRTLRALVADDDFDDRTMICEVLVRCGFDVDEADNGRQALALIRQTDYSIIVLDILMPQVDGFEVLKHLKTRDPEVLARTVVVSRLNLSDMKVFSPSASCSRSHSTSRSSRRSRGSSVTQRTLLWRIEPSSS